MKEQKDNLLTGETGGGKTAGKKTVETVETHTYFVHTVLRTFMSYTYPLSDICTDFDFHLI